MGRLTLALRSRVGTSHVWPLSTCQAYCDQDTAFPMNNVNNWLHVANGHRIGPSHTEHSQLGKWECPPSQLFLGSRARLDGG